ncbi:Fc receptor-like protein 5 [Seriola aureovittata]|uniref:Fc receptor-like protein 5 n=1 Tax=Seriola aureovittata TaxID=2871759 RepID=UPI0024BD8165|nr:Fc receptor-like protein 5 [Seriola aureovittata]
MCIYIHVKYITLFLCLYTAISMWLLLLTQVQDNYCASKADASFPRVVPNSLQHFEYQPISFHCEGFDGEVGGRVMSKTQSKNATCGTTKWRSSGGSLCIIRNVYKEDSGEYWCETGDGKKSNTVNITVTAGSVILESPVLPVMEGDAVTLRCRHKSDSTNLSSSFYKNGCLIKRVSDDNMTISSFSRSDEGLYKCSVSGAGESAESWLTVRGEIVLQLFTIIYIKIYMLAELLMVAS